jgi:hypothetical protein
MASKPVSVTQLTAFAIAQKNYMHSQISGTQALSLFPFQCHEWRAQKIAL